MMFQKLYTLELRMIQFLYPGNVFSGMSFLLDQNVTGCDIITFKSRETLISKIICTITNKLNCYSTWI